MELSNLASKLLWHIAKRKNGGAVSRSEIRQRGLRVRTAELNAACDELIAGGLITCSKAPPSSSGPWATFYTVTAEAMAGHVKCPRRGKRRTDGNKISTAYLPFDLRQQLEEAADRNYVSLSAEITKRLKASFKREKKHAVA